MKSRLYSFEDFLNEAYEIINEAVTWDQGVSPFVALLSGADDAKPLARLKTMINSSGLANPSYNEGEIAQRLQNLVGKFNNASKGIEVKGIKLSLGETTFDQLIAGQAPYENVPSNTSGGPALKTGKDDISKILIAASASNIANKGGGIIKRDGKKLWNVKGAFDEDDEKTESVAELKDIDNTALISGSGVMSQRVLIGAKNKIVFKNSTVKTGPLQGVIGIPEADYQIALVSGSKNAAKSDAKFQPEANFNLVLYVLKGINPNAGTEMPYESLKIEKISVEKGGEAFPLNIQDDGVLFTVAKSDLKEEGKKYISNAIANQFSSVEKIEVIGGASQEGKEDFNKQLCLDRAKAVADFLTKDLGYPATASSETQIQPKESTADRKSWRKVTLKVTGKSRAVVTEETKEKAYYAEQTYKLDQAVIVQAVYSITVDGGFQ